MKEKGREEMEYDPTVTFRLPSGEYARLTREATSRHLKLSDVLREAVREYLESKREGKHV